MRKQCLCAHKIWPLFWTLKFHSFVPKHSLSTKLLQLVQHTMGNLIIYRTCIAYSESEISGIMWRGVFCVHKHCFLMPGHKCTCVMLCWTLTFYKHSHDLFESTSFMVWPATTEPPVVFIPDDIHAWLLKTISLCLLFQLIRILLQWLQRPVCLLFLRITVIAVISKYTHKNTASHVGVYR